MKKHALKTYTIPFDAQWIGVKTYEYRKNDRDFQVGDLLMLYEWAMSDTETGRCIDAVITHIGKGPDFGIRKNYCIMSINIFNRRVCTT